MLPHLLRYQRSAVDYYGFTLDALSERSVDPVAGETGAPSNFAQLRYGIGKNQFRPDQVPLPLAADHFPKASIVSFDFLTCPVQVTAGPEPTPSA